MLRMVRIPPWEFRVLHSEPSSLSTRILRRRWSWTRRVKSQLLLLTEAGAYRADVCLQLAGGTAGKGHGQPSKGGKSSFQFTFT